MEQAVARPDSSRRVISYDEAVRAGVGLFLATGTVDMDALARRLAVSRATLYRVVPGRDRLLGDVLWRQAEVLFARARARATETGAERVLAVLRHFGQELMDSPEFRGFLAREPETALRVLWTPAGRVHRRFVALTVELLQEAADTGMRTRVPADDLAYVLARIFESMWYADLMFNRQPKLDVAEDSARALLQAG